MPLFAPVRRYKRLLWRHIELMAYGIIYAHKLTQSNSQPSEKRTLEIFALT